MTIAHFGIKIVEDLRGKVLLSCNKGNKFSKKFTYTLQHTENGISSVKFLLMKTPYKELFYNLKPLSNVTKVPL